MVRLLSDPYRFKNSIREKVEKKALSAEWNDIVEILPNAPLLERVGQQWYWLFDINANPLQSPKEGATLAAKAAGMQPAPPKQGQTAYVEAQIKEVEQVNAAIRYFTEDRLTLEELGTELRLLPISPTYNSFQLCASNYHAHAGAGPTEQAYASLTSDKSVIEEYAAGVRESVRAIKQTIFLAEFLAYEKHGFARLVQKSPTSRLRSEMMRLVAMDLDFIRFSAQQIGALLSEFDREFERNEGAISNEFQKIKQDASPLDENWISQIQSRMNDSYLQAAPDRAVSEQQNWLDLYFLNRAKALILHLRNKQNLKRLSLRDLRILVSWTLPSPQGQPMEVPAIHGDPDDSPLRDYADALSAARTYVSESSLFLALTLMVKLGFGKQVQAIVPEVAGALGEDSVSDLLDAARANRRAGERIVLILGGQPETRIAVGNANLVGTRKGEGSYAANWTLSKTHAAFPVHVSDLDAFRGPYPKLNKSLVFFLDISMEIQDEGVSSTVGSQGLQGSLGSFGQLAVGKPANLDDAVVVIKKYYEGAPRQG
jgi:hypothetical protein